MPTAQSNKKNENKSWLYYSNQEDSVTFDEHNFKIRERLRIICSGKQRTMFKPIKVRYKCYRDSF